MHTPEFLKKINKYKELAEAGKLKIGEYMATLALEPPIEAIKEQKFAGNYKYLNIEYVLNIADIIFQGQWSYEVIRYSAEFNACCVHVAITYYHPVLHRMVRIDGVGAEALNSMDFSVKLNQNGKEIKNNSVEGAFPTAKTNALKNGLKVLGNIFGRNIADFEQSFSRKIENAEDAILKGNLETISRIEKSYNTDSLAKVIQDNTGCWSEDVKEAASKRLDFLTNN